MQFFVNGKLVIIKEGAPFTPELETPVLLNPLARTVEDKKGSYSMPKELTQSPYPSGNSNAAIAAKLVSSATSGVHGVGVDTEMISAIPTSDSFLERNFTDAEIAYVRKASDFKASLAARWSAKEAVFKALKTVSKGAAASLKDIEIVSTSGAPQVALHGEAKAVADAAGIKSFELSMSHSEDVACAVAIAQK